MKIGNLKKCFVIMPFSKTSEEHTQEYWTEHFDSFLKYHIEEISELKAYRSEPLRGDILRQIITDLVTAPVVVADLTDNNPNVYWELGVRQSFKNCTITIAEDGTEIPFDIGIKGTLFYYPHHHLKNQEFCRKFKNALLDCLKNPNTVDSHVLETLSGRGTLWETIRKEENIRRLDGIIAECERNSMILDEVIKISKENQKKRKEEMAYVTQSFQTAATDFLLTNRYLERNKEFYDNVQIYLLWIMAFNNELVRWFSNPIGINSWFVSSEERTRKLLADYIGKAKLIRGEMVNKFGI